MLGSFPEPAPAAYLLRSIWAGVIVQITSTVAPCLTFHRASSTSARDFSVKIGVANGEAAQRKLFTFPQTQLSLSDDVASTGMSLRLFLTPSNPNARFTA